MHARDGTGISLGGRTWPCFLGRAGHGGHFRRRHPTILHFRHAGRARRGLAAGRGHRARCRFLRGNMNLLAAKIGTLQAKLVSIDGLGQRVAKVAGVAYTDPELASSLPRRSRACRPARSLGRHGRAVHRPDAAHGRLGRGTGPAAGRHPGQAGAAVRQSEAAGRRVDAAFGGPGAHADRHAHHRLSLFEFVLRLAPQPGHGPLGAARRAGLLRAAGHAHSCRVGWRGAGVQVPSGLRQHGRDRPWRRPDPATRTPRRCWSSRGSWSIAASRSLASAAPAVPPVRTCTSRCGWPASRWIRACSWGRSRTLRRPWPARPARTAPRADPAAGCKRDGLIIVPGYYAAGALNWFVSRRTPAQPIT